MMEKLKAMELEDRKKVMKKALKDCSKDDKLKFVGLM